MILKKFSDFVIKYRKIILIVFAVLLALAIVGTVFLATDGKKINSDMMSYFSDDLETGKGISFIQENFGIRGDAIVAVRGGENDAALKASVAKIKAEYADDIEQFIWIEDIEAINALKEQLDGIDREQLDFLEDETVSNLLKDEAFWALLPSLKHIANLPGAINLTVDTEELSAYLKRDLGEGSYDYVMVVMLKHAPSSSEAYAFLDGLKTELLSTGYSVDGQAAERVIAAAGMTDMAQNVLQDTLDDIPYFLLYAIIAVAVILLITSSSFVEPLILMTTLAVSVIISMGINYLYPSISIISFATSAVLQLAVTMDYALFFMHNYRNRRKTLDPLLAAGTAIRESAVTVLASGMTAVGGFAALYCMRFGIGADLSNVLIKGIVLSMLTVLVLQPVLTIICDKAIQKTTHNFTAAINKKIKEKRPDSAGISAAGIFKPIASLSVKARIVIIAVLVALLVPAFLGQNSVKYNYFRIYEEEMVTPEDALAQELGNQTIIAVPLITKGGHTHYDFIDMVLADPNEKVSGVIGAFTLIKNVDTASITAALEILSDPSGISDIQKLIDGMANENSDIYKLLDTYLYNSEGINLEDLNLEQYNLDNIDLNDMFKDFDPEILNSYFSKVDGKWYTLYTVGVRGSAEDGAAVAAYEYLRGCIETVFGKESGYSMGIPTASYEMLKVTPIDFLVVTAVSVAIILIIVWIALKSPVKALILVLLIELGIWINLSITYLTGVPINFMVYIMISGIQLSCTVDYAIFMASAFERNREKCASAKECAVLSASETAPAITTSAAIISAACMALYFVSDNVIIRQLTGMLARGAGLSLVLVVFALPAILSMYKPAKKPMDYEAKLKMLEKAAGDSKGGKGAK